MRASVLETSFSHFEFALQKGLLSWKKTEDEQDQTKQIYIVTELSLSLNVSLLITLALCLDPFNKIDIEKDFPLQSKN